MRTKHLNEYLSLMALRSDSNYLVIVLEHIFRANLRIPRLE